MQTFAARMKPISVSNGYSRRYERKYYCVDIIFSIDDKIFHGCLKDISLGGAFIKAKHTEQLWEEDVVTLSIPFTDGGRHLKRSGRIKWKNSTGFAVTFSDI
jgi:hypothetical protein